MGLLDILQEAIGSDVDAHVDQIAQHASPDAIGAGLAAAMRSDQTPAFGDTVGRLLGQSSPMQQAGVLNQIVATLGPAAASMLAGGVLGRLLQPGQTQLTPEQASQLSPAQVTEIAAHAEEQHAGVIDEVSRFYAQHSGLNKTLGGVAVVIALAKMKENATRGGGVAVLSWPRSQELFNLVLRVRQGRFTPFSFELKQCGVIRP